MKKRLIWAFAALVLFLTGCSVDQGLIEKVNDLDERVSSLEKTVEELNKITIPGLQSIVAAIQGNIYVTSVAPATDGYTITFSNGTTAIIKNGADGEKGDKPAISVIEIDGVFYWAADGEALLDASGNKVPVYTATPQLRINEGKWQISYDEGKTWADVDVMGSAGGSTISIEDGDTTVTFYIDGKKYEIQKELPFYLVFSSRTDLGVTQGKEFIYEYTIKGASEGDELEVDILNCTKGWEARVITLPKGETPGYIGVTNVDDVAGKVFVYASNGRGKTDIKSLCFEGGVLTGSIDVQAVPCTGGEITLSVTANMEYELYIEKTQTWISVLETKAATTKTYTLVCEANETDGFRSAEVSLIDQIGGGKAIMVLQYPSNAVVTSIASLANVEDGAVVELYKQSVLASSLNKAVISDGTDYLAVSGLEAALPVGKEITVKGIKKTNAETYVAYVEVTGYEVTAETSEVTDPESSYIGIAPYYIPSFVSFSGLLSGNVVSAPMGQTVIIDSPAEGLGLAALDGKFVTLSGYVVDSYLPKGSDAETDTLVVKDIKAIEFAQNSSWTLSYSYDEENSDYPETITNTVSGTEVPYMLGLYSEEDYAEYGNNPMALACKLGDDLQFYYYYYSSYTREQLYTIFVKAGATDSDSWEELDYGKYVAVAVGMSADGNPTGEYQTLEFEKKEPVSTATYSDFIGKWLMGGSVITIAEKENGSTYNVTGLANQESNSLSPVTAYFEDGKLILKEYKTSDVWNNSDYGDCDIYLSGRFVSRTKEYSAYPWNTDEPETIFTAYKVDDSGKLTVKAGKCDFGKFTGFALSWIIQSGDYAGKGNTFTPAISISDMEKVAEASAEYKAWIGNYTLSTKSLKTNADTTYNVALREGIANKTLLIDGLGVDGIPLQYSVGDDSFTLVFGKYSSSSTYDFYAGGITNDGYVCTGSPETGAIATFTKDASGVITAKNVVYSLSEERPEVYAAQWGTIGKNISTGKWATFRDVDYIINPATLTPASAPASIKSVANPVPATVVDYVEVAPKIGDNIVSDKMSSKKAADPRIIKSGKESAMKLIK